MNKYVCRYIKNPKKKNLQKKTSNFDHVISYIKTPSLRSLVFNFFFHGAKKKKVFLVSQARKKKYIHRPKA